MGRPLVVARLVLQLYWLRVRLLLSLAFDRVRLAFVGIACRVKDRHRNGSPAWMRIGGTNVAGFRERPVFACRHCGVVALLDNEPRRLAQLGRQRFGGKGGRS